MTVAELIRELGAYPSDWRVQLPPMAGCEDCGDDDWPRREVDALDTVPDASGHGLAVKLS